MTKHQFGGDWTAEKLNRVRKYLEAYTLIFTRNPQARSFTTIYVDAFAGTGHRVDSAGDTASGGLFDSVESADAEAYKKGSARIALEVEPGFNRYLFMEHGAGHVKELTALVKTFSNKEGSVDIRRGDANDLLEQWCTETDWRRHRAVVFLDPYGMQVRWTLLETIARTQAIDLWLLFPLGMAVNRLLTKHGPPPPLWAERLTETFGTAEWEPAFYRKQNQLDLFDVGGSEEKSATFDSIAEFFVNRLKSIFTQVAEKPLRLHNSTYTPIYLLCFAAGNPKGASTAVRIANDLLKP